MIAHTAAYYGQDPREVIEWSSEDIDYWHDAANAVEKQKIESAKTNK